MFRVKHLLSKYKLIIVLSGIFFAVRLYHLTAIPIFNDEAIYLDWGWRELHRPNNLFYSLYDAKPPFLMWLFGIASIIFSNLWWAGRFMSVLFGYLTLMGIWKLTKRVSSEQSAVIASLFYIVIPLFSFFDRQALMESAIGAVGVWACYATLRLIETKKPLWAISLGIILGVGCFIKLNALLFCLTVVVILAIHCLGIQKNVRYFLTQIFIIGCVMVLVLSPMLMQSMFWETIHLNNRYIVTTSLLPSLLLSHLLSNFIEALKILFLHFNPIPFALLSSAILLLVLKRPKRLIYVTVWFFVSFVVDILLAGNVIERYIVSFLPLATVFMSYPLSLIRNRLYQNLLICLSFGTTCLVTLFQLIYPVSYFSVLSWISPLSFIEYRKGFTSGYGIPEAVVFLNQQIGNRPAFIATALHTGNPENGIMTAFMKRENVSLSYLVASEINNIYTYDCLSSPIPIYFVSREDDQAGLDRFLQRIYFARNPISGFGIGIYTLKESCVGKTLRLRGQKT